MVHTDGNALSVLVFFLWIPFALWGASRWPPAKAASLLLLLPMMFLPERVRFNIFGILTLTKNEIALLCLWAAAFFFHRNRLQGIFLNRWVKVAMVGLVLGRVTTVFLNMDGISQYSKYLSPHSPFDAVRSALSASILYILPVVLGAAMFRSSRDLRVLFQTIAGAALFYGLLQLVEVRLSPQLNNWVYGFFQHTFMQMKRQGGFRPIVFMAHGLTVAMFTMTGLLAAAALFKAKSKIWKVKPEWAMAFLAVVAVLNKSLAAGLYALTAVPMVLYSKPTTQFRVAVALAVVVLVYPALRGADMVPVEGIVETVTEQFGEQRAGSLAFRFDSEEGILQRAMERPWFGWGTYGRSFIYHPKSGKQLTIPDGDWVNTIGMYGFVGFLTKYLLMILPLLSMWPKFKYVRHAKDQLFIAALALALGFSLFDMIPNSSAHYMPFVFAGAILGSTSGTLAAQVRLKRARQRKAALARKELDAAQ